MHFRESETVELKSAYTEGIRKEIIAMANSYGGDIYLGVDDDGTVVGVEDADTLIQRVANGMRDAVRPDITLFLRYETLDIDEKLIVAVRVQRGTARPYYLAAKGLRPEGVFVRQGTSSVPASDAAIRQMIRETDGNVFEDIRSLNQALTFETATAAFSARGLEFGPVQMQTLGLMDGGGLYTNLGLLLSDQCPHIIKGAVFGGADRQDFQDRREFGGSLLRQLSDAYSFLNLHNRNSATFEGLYRVDHRDYPEAALREALLNAIVHRDYSFSAGTLVSVYADRIEIVSVGGLVQGISLEDVLLGLSVCRNPKLANVFFRLNLIEAYGTGMGKILDAYRGSDQTPDIQATPNAFKVTLPKRQTEDKDDVADSLAAEASAILDLAHANGSISRGKVEELLGVSQSSAARILKKMVDANYLEITGKGKNRRYIPK